MNNIKTYEELISEVSSNESIKNKLCVFTENASKFFTEVVKDEHIADKLRNYGKKLEVENEEMIKNAEEKISGYTTEELVNATEMYLDLINKPGFLEAVKEKYVEMISNDV